MTINGFLFDVDAAHKMSSNLRDAERSARARVEQALGRKLASTDTGGISAKDLELRLFRELRAPVMYRSRLTRKPSLGIDAMRAYAASARPELAEFAIAELERRRARKVRVTYIDRVLGRLAHDGRVHASYKTYGTVTGRWSASDPNLFNLPSVRNDPTVIWGVDDAGERIQVGGGIRSLYIAPSGYTLVNLDFGQLEFRIAAYASGDANMIRACEAGDIHSANAELVWGAAFRDADKPTRKALRALAKNFGFAIAYGAEAPTLWANLRANGQDVTLQAVQAALRKLRSAFTTYYRWQDARLRECIRRGYTDTALLGRRRWTGHTPQPTEVMNFVVQGGGAEVVTRKICKIDDEIHRLHLNAKPVCSVYDSFVVEVSQAHAAEYTELAKRVCAEPVTISTSGKDLQAVFPIDIDSSPRWS